MKKIIGLAFIEFLFALTLGLLSLAVTYEIYLSAYHAYQLQMAFHHIQQNAKLSIHLLNTAIKEAGKIGCMQLTENYPLLSYSLYSMTAKNKLIGIGKNELIVRHIQLPTSTLIRPIQNHSIIFTDTSLAVTAGDILLISDCKHAELFVVSHVNTSHEEEIITSYTPLQYDYDASAELGRLKIERFYVAKTAYKNPDGSFIFSLFSEEMIKKRKQELVSHLNAMRFLFTLNLNGRLVTLTADDVNDWSQVIAVSIELEFNYPLLKTTWYDDVTIN
ncbi:MAG: hypothetical protein JO149_03330 [Gammaproteobacteria bacterium]|nr:hypothetical protein [Gammaproteobacteria bacterium]